MRVDSRDGAWLAAGAHDATITGTQEVSGSLGIIDYPVMGDSILFVALFTVVDDVGDGDGNHQQDSLKSPLPKGRVISMENPQDAVCLIMFIVFTLVVGSVPVLAIWRKDKEY